jgi:nucleotidyltransferase substrate binding protein (TIGR01987 family)
MNRQQIIKSVISIILRHARPERIWLFGSEASGESTARSDIDIAFEDADFKDDHLISDEIEELKTLVKIDVKNIAHAEDRFRNRVKDAGRVLYSANKKLRAEDGIYNFTKALNRFRSALDNRQAYVKGGFADIIPDLVMQRFEFTYEMSWKAIKRYLDFVGIECANPRSAFKEAFAQGVIEAEAVWLDMVEKRNHSSHIYDENEIKAILGVMDDYLKAFESLSVKLQSELHKNS